MQNPKVAVPRGGYSWLQTRKGVWLAFVGSLLCTLANLSATAQSNAKNVLVLYSYFNRGPSAWLDSIESTTRAHVPETVNFYVSYPETELFDDQAYQESQAETLRREYERVKLDLVIVVSDPALRAIRLATPRSSTGSEIAIGETPPLKKTAERYGFSEFKEVILW